MCHCTGTPGCRSGWRHLELMNQRLLEGALVEDEEVVFDEHRPVRVITAASLFDGHDAAINVMRRLIQSSGPK